VCVCVCGAVTQQFARLCVCVCVCVCLSCVVDKSVFQSEISSSGLIPSTNIRLQEEALKVIIC
jgi:hypothetical protein